MKHLGIKSAVILPFLLPLAIDCNHKKYLSFHLPLLDAVSIPHSFAVSAPATAQILITKTARKGDVLLSSRFGTSYMANDKLLLQVGSFDERSARFYIYCKKGGEAFSYSFSVGFDGKNDGNSSIISALGLTQLKVERKDAKTILVKNLPVSLPIKFPNFETIGAKNVDPMGNLGCLSNPSTALAKEIAIGREFFVYRRGAQPFYLRVTDIRDNGFLVNAIVPTSSTSRNSTYSLAASFMFYDVAIPFADLPKISNDFCSRGNESNLLPGLLIMRISETFNQTFSNFEKSENTPTPPNNIPKSFGKDIISAGHSLYSFLNVRSKLKIIDTTYGFAISDGKLAVFDIASLAVVDYSYGTSASYTIPYQITSTGIVFDCNRNSQLYLNLAIAAPFVHTSCKK